MVSFLLVCTGNICRSPMAEAFVRRSFAAFTEEIEVASAGVIGWDGSPAVQEAVGAAAERGVDVSRHVARRLEAREVEAADVVICMAGEHRDAVARLVPTAGPKTFGLKELTRLLEGLPEPPVPEPTDEQIRHRIALADRLRRSGFEGERGDEDVADPLGMPLDMFRSVAWEIDEWCDRLARALGATSSRVS